MGQIIPIPHPVIPAAVARVIMRIPREKLEMFIAIAIDLVDVMDGDADLEATELEDDFIDHPTDGPGCRIADSDYCTAHDDDMFMRGDFLPGDPDDSEDCDPAGGNVEDNGEPEDGILHPLYGEDQTLGPINEAEQVRAWHIDQRGKDGGV